MADRNEPRITAEFVDWSSQPESEGKHASERGSAAFAIADTLSNGNLYVHELPDAAPVQAGMIVKHYEIIRPIGSGGMGTVYLARDTRLGRLVAMKFLLETSEDARRRFVAEARTTAQCRHENIVVIHDVDEIEGRPYMVLEYLEGRTLRDIIASVTQPNVAMIVDWMLPVARALACAHGMGIVHRDLKPENIFLSENGQIKVLDFGIAKRMRLKWPKSSGGQTNLSSLPEGFTQHGAIVGTIPYMAPEQWLELPLDGQCDIWAAGIILFELATGHHPLAPLNANSWSRLSNPDEPMPSAQLELAHAPELADIIDDCLKKPRDQRLASAIALAEALETLRAQKELGVREEDENPYAGLSAFQESDAHRFFGRDDDISAIVGRLRQQPLVAIAGASGAGKSSLVRAGVVPAFKRAYRTVETFVVRPGRQPLAALADVLAFLVDSAGDTTHADARVIAETLRTEPGYLGATLRARCRRRSAEHRVLLFIDQLEELYTQGIEATERAAFCACVEGVADDASSPLRVVMTIRADFLDRVADEHRFLTLMTRGLLFLPPVSPHGLRNALEKPLQRAGYQFEDENLCHQILDDLAGTKSPLPLLQFAAAKLWEERDRQAKRVTRSAYAALGGVAGALSSHADATLVGMSSVEKQMAQLILLRLVTPERTRAVVRLEELQLVNREASEVGHVVQRLAEARLVTIEAGGDREEKTVELTHESLIDKWSKLKGWLDESAKDASFLAELRQVAAQWDKNGQAEGLLWRDRAAESAGQWLKQYRTDARSTDSARIGPRELAYLEAVVELSERAARRKLQWIGALVGAAIMVVIVVGLLALDARAQARRADEQARLADEQARNAQTHAQHAETEALRARNATRMAAARALQEKDPTMVLALLREIEPESIPAGWAMLAMNALTSHVSEFILHHEDEVAEASWSSDGEYLATSTNKQLRVWKKNRLVFNAMHDEPIVSIAFRPDGRRIMSASFDKIQIWNVDGQEKPIVLDGHQDRILHAAWSPDGQRIASASHDKTARIWDPYGKGAGVILRGHSDAVTRVEFSPDGQRVVTVSPDKTIRIWKTDGSNESIVLEGHEGAIFSTTMSPDGRRILSTSADNTLRIWNTDGSGSSTIVQRGERIYLATWNSTGRRIFTPAPASSKVHMWDLDNRSESVVFQESEDAVGRAAFSPDERRIALLRNNRIIVVRNVDQTGDAYTFEGHEEGTRIGSIQFSPDGERIASAARDKTVRVWKVRRPGTTRIFEGHTEPILDAVMSADGRRIVSGSDDKTVRIWNSDGTGKTIVLRGHTGAVFRVLFSPDGQRVLSIADDNTIRIWNADGTGDSIVFDGEGVPFHSAAFSADGQRVAAASEDRMIRIWYGNGEGNPRVFQGHRDGVLMVNFSADGQHIVSASRDKTVRVWNVDGTGEPMVFEGHTNDVIQATFSPDGRKIVSLSKDRTIRVWDAKGKNSPVVFKVNGFINAVVFSPDSQRIAYFAGDELVLCNADGSGKPTVFPKLDSQTGVDMFHPDGRRLLSSGNDGLVRVWKTDANEEPLLLRLPNPHIVVAAFSPDGQRVMAVSDDKAIHLFEDLVPLRGPEDRRLWGASAYCMPLDVRKRWLGFGEEQARKDLERCELHVAARQ